ncbi:MAG: hypothetical protein JWM02_2604 [Frankiales bacterium]|nr:hypothetical protein [Frankiales bacterium]
MPAEELSWDAPVALHAESRVPRDDEPARGFLLRVHSDPDCPSRLVPSAALVTRHYERLKSDAVCSACGTELIATASSNVIRRLLEAERTLNTLRDLALEGPMPREIVHCRALRFEAQSAVSVHPDAPELAGRVADLASEVGEALRAAMAAHDRRSSRPGR